MIIDQQVLRENNNTRTEKAESSNFASYVCLGVPKLMQKALPNGTENVVVSHM